MHSLDSVAVGDIIPDIYNGSQAGHFGWLTWTGTPNEGALVTSLSPPGNSVTYVNSTDPNDHLVSVGDWVQGRPGVTSSDQVRAALDTLTTRDITVPVWDTAQDASNHTLYHVVAFARVRLTAYQLPGKNRISAQFLGQVRCSE